MIVIMLENIAGPNQAASNPSGSIPFILSGCMKAILEPEKQADWPLIGLFV